jgi:hypothetical protein
MQLTERVNNYCTETGFPKTIFVGEDNRISGIWIMGNNYTVKSKYYGGYPHGYLKRLKALFPDKKRVLHLCSGKVDTSILPGDTVDINPNLKPTFIDDAHTLLNTPIEDYDLIAIDVPYSNEDAVHYGTPMVNRNKIMRTLGARLRHGTHIAWLDQVLPMYRKIEFSQVGVIGIEKSTNHRFRCLVMFEKT